MINQNELQVFNITKITNQLQEINKLAGKKCAAGIQLTINNMILYNYLVVEGDRKDTKKNYLIFQLSSSIANQLVRFNIYPKLESLRDKEESKEDDFTKMIKSIKNINE